MICPSPKSGQIFRFVHSIKPYLFVLSLKNKRKENKNKLKTNQKQRKTNKRKTNNNEQTTKQKKQKQMMTKIK